MRKILLFTLLTLSSCFGCVNAQEAKAYGSITGLVGIFEASQTILQLDTLEDSSFQVTTSDAVLLPSGGIAFPAGILSGSESISVNYFVQEQLITSANLYWTQDQGEGSLKQVPKTQGQFVEKFDGKVIYLTFSGDVSLNMLSGFDSTKPLAFYLGVTIFDFDKAAIAFPTISVAVGEPFQESRAFATAQSTTSTTVFSEALLPLNVLTPPIFNVFRSNTESIGFSPGGIAFFPNSPTFQFSEISVDYSLTISAAPGTVVNAELVWIQEFSENIADYHEIPSSRTSFTPSSTSPKLKYTASIDLNRLDFDRSQPFALYLKVSSPDNKSFEVESLASITMVGLR